MSLSGHDRIRPGLSFHLAFPALLTLAFALGLTPQAFAQVNPDRIE